MVCDRSNMLDPPFTMLNPSYKDGIDFSNWIILDGLPNGTDDYLWTFLELDVNPNVINKRIVVHQTDPPKTIGVVIYSDSKTATLSLMSLRYKLRRFNVSCFWAYDLLHLMKERQSEKKSEFISGTENIVSVELTLPDTYPEYVRGKYGFHSDSLIYADVDDGIKEIAKQNKHFTYEYLFKMFGEMIALPRRRRFRFYYKYWTDAITAQWGLGNMELGGFKFLLSCPHPTISAEYFEPLPFIKELQAAKLEPPKAFQLEKFILCTCKNVIKKDLKVKENTFMRMRSKFNIFRFSKLSDDAENPSTGNKNMYESKVICMFCETKSLLIWYCFRKGKQCRFPNEEDKGAACLECGYVAPKYVFDSHKSAGKSRHLPQKRSWKSAIIEIFGD